MGILIVLPRPLARPLLMRCRRDPYTFFGDLNLFWQVVVTTALLVVLVEMAPIILVGMVVRRLSAWSILSRPWLATLITLLLPSISSEAGGRG